MNQAAGIIVAAGTATRAGGDKALLPFAGGALIDAVIARVAPQVSQLALNVPAASVDKYRSRYPGHSLFFDSILGSVGPLAGVIVGLEWLRSAGIAEWLATFPCDTPFLPSDLVTQLMAEARDSPVFAHDGSRLHGLCAVWPVHCLEQLRAGVENGALRSLNSAMESLHGRTCGIEADEYAFFNVNTRADLIRAEQLAPGM